MLKNMINLGNREKSENLNLKLTDKRKNLVLAINTMWVNEPESIHNRQKYITDRNTYRHNRQKYIHT